MRTFVGALLLGAGASAVAVLLAVAGDTTPDRQVASEPAGQACETAGEDCEAAGIVLLGSAAQGVLSVAAEEMEVAPAAATDIFPEHPYPDHP